MVLKKNRTEFLQSEAIYIRCPRHDTFKHVSRIQMNVTNYGQPHNLHVALKKDVQVSRKYVGKMNSCWPISPSFVANILFTIRTI